MQRVRVGIHPARMTASSKPSAEAKTHSFESLRQHRESLIGLLRQRPFTVYGLDTTWNRRRWLAGGGSSGPHARSFVLGHGDARGDAAEVSVETWAPGGTSQMAGIRVTRRLAMHLWHAGAEHGVVRPSFSEEDPAGSWDLVTASISGDPHPLRVLRADPAWVGFAEASGPIGHHRRPKYRAGGCPSRRGGRYRDVPRGRRAPTLNELAIGSYSVRVPYGLPRSRT